MNPAEVREQLVWHVIYRHSGGALTPDRLMRMSWPARLNTCWRLPTHVRACVHFFMCEDLRPAHRLLCFPYVPCMRTQLEQELSKKLGAVAAIHALVDTVGMQLEAAKSTMAVHLNSTLESSTNTTLLQQVRMHRSGQKHQHHVRELEPAVPLFAVWDLTWTKTS